jgi:predicted porin
MSGKRQTTIARLCAACAFSALIIGSSHARADETTNALLDLLKSKGAITQTEYDKIKARQQAEAKDSAQKLQAAETRAREAEAKAHEAEAKAHEAEAKAESDSAEVAKVKAQTLTAADMAIPTKMAPKAPVAYVTALTKCVGIRVNQVDICIKGDISFFGVEQWPDHNTTNGFFLDQHGVPTPTNTLIPTPSVLGGLATVGNHPSNSIRGGLLPSSIQVGISTNQYGLDIGAYFGVYVGGNNIEPNIVNANGNGSPFGLGTAGVDFRQVFGTIGTPWWGTVKIGRDIGIFASDAILNDLTLLGVGSPRNNLAPTNTTLGRIGIGYIYTDFIPQITYKSPTWAGFTFWVSAMTPMDELAFSGDQFSANMTGHDLPMGQAKVQWVGTWSPDLKLTLSASGMVQKQQAECLNGAVDTLGATNFFSTCAGLNAPSFFNGVPLMSAGTNVTTWAADAFAMLEVWGFNLVAYGYTGKGVGTTGLFFDGVDIFGDRRRSDGGYLQAAYTFKGGWWLPNPLTVGASWGVSSLETAGTSNAFEINQCHLGATFPGAFGCLVKHNESWIGFARYNLTDWVKIQAEYTATVSENQIGQEIHDKAFALGTTFFW